MAISSLSNEDLLSESRSRSCSRTLSPISDLTLSISFSIPVRSSLYLANLLSASEILDLNDERSDFCSSSSPSRLALLRDASFNLSESVANSVFTLSISKKHRFSEVSASFTSRSAASIFASSRAMQLWISSILLLTLRCSSSPFWSISLSISFSLSSKEESSFLLDSRLSISFSFSAVRDPHSSSRALSSLSDSLSFASKRYASCLLLSSRHALYLKARSRSACKRASCCPTSSRITSTRAILSLTISSSTMARCFFSSNSEIPAISSIILLLSVGPISIILVTSPWRTTL